MIHGHNVHSYIKFTNETKVHQLMGTQTS